MFLLKLSIICGWAKIFKKDIVNLCHSDISPDKRDLSDAWQQIKNNISTKVSDLPLPESIINKLMPIVPFVRKSVVDWMWYHETVLNINGYSKYTVIDLISNILWIARGKIDCAQTAKNILAGNNTFLSYDHRYKHACTYCLEDEIVDLAGKIVSKDYLDNVEIRTYPVVHFWRVYIIENSIKLYTRYCDNIYYSNVDENEQSSITTW